MKPNHEEEDRFNVLLVGQIGVGKTSLLNTFLSVLRDEVVPIAYTAADDRSVTTTVSSTRHVIA